MTRWFLVGARGASREGYVCRLGEKHGASVTVLVNAAAQSGRPTVYHISDAAAIKKHFSNH